MKAPEVTVAMAVCNVERFLAEAIESVLGQTFADFEFVIVDFGSTDRSGEILSHYAAIDDRIHLYDKAGCTLVEARNEACAQANGRYIAVMDADDVCLSDRLRLEVEFLERNREVALVGGATDWIDANGKSLGIHELPTDDAEINTSLETRFPFCHPTLLIRREAFSAVGGYRKAFVFAHDYDLAVRIGERFRCANLAQVVLKYRIHPSQVSLRRQEQQTLCRLAAQVSASYRRSGKADPIDRADRITPETLVALGLPESRIRSIVVADGRNWIRSMVAAGEYSTALAAANAPEMLNSGAESWQIADLYLTVARMHWRRREFAQAAVAAGRALAKRPLVAGRPLVGLWRRIARSAEK